MHIDMLGFPGCLLNVEMLLHSGISREDGELVELVAVLERHPRTCVQALVQLSNDAYPGGFSMHLLDHLVPLRLRLTDKKDVVQLVGL